MLQVHVQFDLTAEQLGRLRELLDPRIQITAGALPDPAEFEILVHGFPAREDLQASPNLRMLVVPWAGPPLETIDLLREFPHLALHSVHYNAGPTAEMAVALLLAAAKLIIPHDRHFRQHRWAPLEPGRQTSVLLEGKTAVVLGYGRVGRRVADAVRGLGMQVQSVRRERRPEDPDHVHGIAALPDLLPAATALLICLPLTHATTSLLGDAELARLPKEAVLVNVARGDIVQEEALYRALAERRIFAAGIDVWYRSPGRSERKSRIPTPPSRFPFHELDNVVMSPHRAGWSLETEEMRIRHLAALLNAAARGETPPNRVNLVRGY